MPKDEKPLPKPPKTPFGKSRMSEEERGSQSPLMADQLAMAAATGNLDDYMKNNLPDNEHARKLAMMMMGMTGMMPPGVVPEMTQVSEPGSTTAPSEQSDTPSSETEVPEDVRMAIMTGNLEALKEMLMREHAKRTGSAIEPSDAPATHEAGFNTAPSGIEKEVLDELINIAAANSVTLDWLIMRALKTFISDYNKNGRL